MKKEIAILIPCYNEELTIKNVVQDFKACVPEAKIYVYDNNSTDKTAKIAKEAGAIVKHSPLQGKGNVVRQMFREIDADAYIMVDGDDTYPAPEAKKMVELVLNEGVDMVIGDRLSTTYYSENKKLFNGLGNRLVHFLINELFNANISDIMTGYRAFSKRFVKSIPVISNGFEIETEMTIYALRNHMIVYSIPIQYKDRPAGSNSKLNTVVDGVKVLWTIFVNAIALKPLQTLGVIGLVFVLYGMLLNVYIYFAGLAILSTMIVLMAINYHEQRTQTLLTNVMGELNEKGTKKSK